MNANLLRRLFTAVAKLQPQEARLVCARIVEDERRKGHTKLAKELTGLLEKANQGSPSLTPFPSSTPVGKSSAPLIQDIPHDRLRHHMVLPADVESRFLRIEKEFAAKTRLKKHGYRPRCRILLHGPPGCGKNLGAERLAWNTGLSLHRVRFETLLSSYFGETATNLHRLF